MINGDSRNNYAERLGHRFGLGWRTCARGERKVIAWLVSRGFSSVRASVLLWSVKLVVWALLLYAAFWLALLVAFVVVIAWVARNTGLGDEEQALTEWRYGPSGYGLYTSDGYRIDPHDPEDE